MKRFLKVAASATILALAISGCGQKVEKKPIVLATTTSVRDSGLMDVLKPEFEKQTKIKVDIVAQGTGQALQTAKDGNADVVLVHDKASEEKFIQEGYGVDRNEIMYNYFVIVGPKDDKAGVAKLEKKDAAEALKKVKESNSPFVSRGDDSGTHKKELSLWKSVNITPSGNWYISAGRGMGDCLTMASEKQGYILSDKATFLSMKDKLNLKILLENADNLKNTYTVIAVNPEKNSNINKEGADEFIKWMKSDKAKKLIKEYGKDKYGEALFTLIEK